MELKHIGRYDIMSLIGQGGMSAVYLGYDPRSQREVAIKILPPYYSHADKFRERFEREALTIALLEHPAIVPVYDMGEEDGQPYIVMRYMSGGSLAEKLKRGPILLRDCVDMYLRLAPALDTAHARGVTHRDVKPDNLLFDKYGNVFLSDFGLARLRETIGFANISDGSIMGTPAYMSPEQIQGDREIDGRSDIYSMGVVLYHMLSGLVPFSGATAASVMMMHLINPVPQICEKNKSLPVAVQSVLDTAMAKNPSDRYQSAGDFAKALQSVTTGVYKKLSLSNSDITGPLRYGKRSTSIVTPEASPRSNNEQSVSSEENPQPDEIPPENLSTTPPESIEPLISEQVVVASTKKFDLLTRIVQAIPLWGWAVSIVAIILLSLVLVQGLRSGFPFSRLKPTNLYPVSTSIQNNPQASSPRSPLTLGQADKLAFLNASQIWVSNLDGSDLIQLTSDSTRKSNLRWSPDGQSVIYISDRCIQAVGLQTRLVSTLTCFSGITSLNAFDISPNGQDFALSLDQTRLYIFPYSRLFSLRSTSQMEDLATLAACSYYAPYTTSDAIRDITWSQVDERLAVLFYKLVDGLNRDEIQILDFSQCAPEPVMVKEIPPSFFLFTLRGYYDNPEISSLSWNSKDQILLSGYLNSLGFGDLQVYSLTQDRSMAIAPNGPCCYRDAHWSPDGTYLFYSYQPETGGEISLYYTPATRLDVASGTMASLTLPAGFLANSLDSLQPTLRAVH